MYRVSEDEPVLDILKKKEQPLNKWDDEDLDDIKDSWEDEEEPALEPKAQPPPTEKGPKKAGVKSTEKKGKAVEAVNEAPLDPLEEKLRQQRLVEVADYKSTAELFAKKGDEKTLDSFIPKTESDFSEYAELVSHKLRPYEKSYHYIGLLKAVMRLSTTTLKGADAKEVASSICAIANEKIKAEKEANAAKKKPGYIFFFHDVFDGIINFDLDDMSMSKPLSKLMSCVILDLDGTLINTDGIVCDVLRVHLVKFGKKWDGKRAHRIVGKTPYEAAAAIVEDYELPVTADEFLSELTPIFSKKWGSIKAQPGANRLINHLRGHGVPIALASNSSKENVETKISFHRGWKESFSVILGGDEVTNGKPSPEIYLEAAKRLKMDTSTCLVIEDSLPGVTAGKAAGMEVVAVPSLPKQTDVFTSADEVINSLLDLKLEKWGLPAFEDWVEGTLPIEPWSIGGPVIKGFGRGSKVLGIPTANLSMEAYSDVLSEHPSGVYFGWAGLAGRGIYKMVMSVGWNPYFNNSEKTIEPWLLHDFDEDFYGEDLRLVIVGYIRPEANFPSLESLVAKIHEDKKIAEEALELPLYLKYRDDSYLDTSSKQNC